MQYSNVDVFYEARTLPPVFSAYDSFFSISRIKQCTDITMDDLLTVHQ